MPTILLLLLAAVTAVAADDPWAKVRELKSGVELRIYKKGAVQPVLARMDEATAENLVVVVTNEQMAIARDQIERIDYRPAGGRAITQSKTTTDDPAAAARGRRPFEAPRGPRASTSGGLSVGSRLDFETIYRRPVAASQKPGPKPAR